MAPLNHDTEGHPMTWRVAASLGVLLEEIDHAAPLRSRVSDGSIGDAAHASRDSDHNPWVTDANGVGVVRARDFTNDPTGGLDCNQLAARLANRIRLGAHPACLAGAYVIWQRRILSYDRRAEGWRPYTGSNPHDHHLHLSVALAPAGYDTPNRWGVMDTEEDDMPAPKDWTEEDWAAFDEHVEASARRGVLMATVNNAGTTVKAALEIAWRKLNA